MPEWGDFHSQVRPEAEQSASGFGYLKRQLTLVRVERDKRLIRRYSAKMASWAIAEYQNNTPMPNVPMIQVNEFMVPDDDFKQSNLERLPNITRTEMSKGIITERHARRYCRHELRHHKWEQPQLE